MTVLLCSCSLWFWQTFQHHSRLCPLSLLPMVPVLVLAPVITYYTASSPVLLLVSLSPQWAQRNKHHSVLCLQPFVGCQGSFGQAPTPWFLLQGPPGTGLWLSATLLVVPPHLVPTIPATLNSLQFAKLVSPFFVLPLLAKLLGMMLLICSRKHPLLGQIWGHSCEFLGLAQAILLLLPGVPIALLDWKLCEGWGCVWFTFLSRAQPSA